MAKNISLLGADYPDVPAVTLPQTGGGTATFYDVEVTDGDPTLAWGTRSKVGTVNGTDLHVTMPANPAPEVYNGLDSASTTKALSAYQGNVLNGKRVRKSSQAVTTNANGAAKLSNLSSSYNCVGVYTDGNGYMAVPFKLSDGWYIRLMEYNSNGNVIVVPNTSVTIYYLYTTS